VAQAQVNNIIDNHHTWKPVNHTRFFYSKDGMLNIITGTDYPGKEYNRLVLQTQLHTAKTPILLSLDYASKSFEGKAMFVAEIRDNNGRNVLWDSFLNNTKGNFTNKSFVLPSNITGKPIQIRLYTITNGPGLHNLSLKNATMEYVTTATNIRSLNTNGNNTDNSNATKVAPQLTGTNKNNTYDVSIGAKVYPIKYEITGQGNKLDNITAQTKSTELKAAITSPSNGKLIVELPKNLIDSKKAATIGESMGEDSFAVLEDGQSTTFDEIKNSTYSRTLSIDFDKGSTNIEIVGTEMSASNTSSAGVATTASTNKTAVPEFGGVASAVLLVAVLGVILTYSKYNGKFTFMQRR
jgi:hypothetical protein